MLTTTHSDRARAEAEAAFKTSEPSNEDPTAAADRSAEDAMREKTARLRALRLARDSKLKEQALPPSSAEAPARRRLRRGV